MTTIIVDEDGGCMMGTLLPPPPGFVPPTIEKLLQNGFEDGWAEFYLCDGHPMVVWPDLDYATNWATYPIREVHPFHPIIHGKQITEEEFREKVKGIHGLE